MISLFVMYLFHYFMFRCGYKLKHNYKMKKEIYKESFGVNYKKYKINGYLYYKDNYDDSKIIIITHGLGTDHLSHLKEIEHFVDLGYLVVGYDAIGVTLSYNKSVLGLGGASLSLDKVLDYILSFYPKSKIYLYGHSWGGYAVLSNTLWHKISGVVSVAPFINSRRIYKDRVCVLAYIFYPLFYLIEKIRVKKYGLCDLSIILNDIKIPVIITASTDDLVVNYNNHFKHLKDNINNDYVKFIEFSSKGHDAMYSLESIKKIEEAKTYYKSLSDDLKLEYKINNPLDNIKELDKMLFDEIDRMIIND